MSVSIFGTSHFVSKQAAIRYYRPYGYTEVSRVVEQKIADGEIHIGAPALKSNQNCYVNADEGRYFIEESNKCINWPCQKPTGHSGPCSSEDAR